MKDALFIFAAMGLLALLGMGKSHADSKYELAARIVMLKDVVIGLQVRKCALHARAEECTHDTSLLFQQIEKLHVDTDTANPESEPDGSALFKLDQRFGICMQQLYALRRKYAM